MTAVYAAAGATVGAITQLLDPAANRIVLYAAAGAIVGGAVRWGWRHVIRPARVTLSRAAELLDVVEQLPAWTEDIESSVSELDARVTRLERPRTPAPSPSP